MAYLGERKKLYGKSAPKLPGLEEYTNDQLFFLAGSLKFCGRQPPLLHATDSWYMGEHPEGTVRNNERLKNFEFFASAFKCKLNSTMNPPKKCQVYRRIHRH
ncbi:unnamed protein product, partial [Mesorhabditis spiculigera]